MKTIEYKVREVTAGQVFGAEEVLIKDIDRCMQAKATTDGELQYIDMAELHLKMTDDDVDVIMKSGELLFIQPIQIAKEFINHKKAINKRK